MKKVFIIHGFEGSPNGGWRPWLMGELARLDVYACALPMPAPEDPYTSEWVEEIKRQVDRNHNDEIYLVGHSLGVPAILRYLESDKSIAIAGVVLVSGPALKTDDDKVNRFLETDFDFEAIVARSKRFSVVHGDNDTVVPLSDAKILCESLHSELRVVKNGGHLNGSAGWLTLPECLDALKAMMS